MYLYLLNRPSYEDKIAQLECLCLTGARTDTGYAVSDIYVDCNRPAYIDACIQLYCEEHDALSLYNSIKNLNYGRNNFRIRFINTGVHVDFKDRKAYEKEISDIFTGAPNLKNPDSDFALTFTGDMWMFGRIIWETKNRWLKYNKKPNTFCNALPSRMARALVNIGTMNDTHVRILDPCCGMGTVLLQALDMKIEIDGCDINRVVVKDGNENLEYFGFEKRIQCCDAAEITKSYDIAIVDLPYGILSKKGSDRYEEIINNMRRICSRSVILSSGDISDIIENAGFNIIEKCIVHKGGLDRHISLCE